MGCDIHFFIERRDDKDHKWYLDPNHTRDEDEVIDGRTYGGHWNDCPSAGRWYGMFNTMCGGVRGNEEDSLFQPRGAPEDLSPEGHEAMHQYGPDGHSHSWLSLEEFKQCLDAMDCDVEKNKSTQAFYDYQDFKRYEDRPPEWTTIYNYAVKWIEDQKKAQADLTPHLRLEPEVRFIFFFDN